MKFKDFIQFKTKVHVWDSFDEPNGDLHVYKRNTKDGHDLFFVRLEFAQEDVQENCYLYSDGVYSQIADFITAWGRDYIEKEKRIIIHDHCINDNCISWAWIADELNLIQEWEKTKELSYWSQNLKL